jgi:hypothetical protein
MCPRLQAQENRTADKPQADKQKSFLFFPRVRFKKRANIESACQKIKKAADHQIEINR